MGHLIPAREVLFEPKTRRFFLGAMTAPSAVRVWGANDKVNVGIAGLGSRALNIEPGPTPKFRSDAEAARLITRPVYRKPYEV